MTHLTPEEVVREIDSTKSQLGFAPPSLAPNTGNLPTISASKLKVARTCARKYYYKYVLPHDQRPIEAKSVFALRGTALHKAIEDKYSAGHNPALTYQRVMVDTFAEWQEAGYKIVGEDYFAKALKDGKDMIKLIQWEAFIPETLEHRFSLPFPNAEAPVAMVEGIIDMITMEGSVIDHKSASKKPNLVELAHDPQFIIYRWAYEQIYDAVPYRVVWHHLKDGSIIDSRVNDNYEEKLAQLELDITGVVNMTSYPRRLLDNECRQCPFFTLCYSDSTPKEEE